MSDVPIFYNLQTAGDVTAITGRLSDLETTVNTNLVAAINEIDGKFPVSIANGGTGGTTATDARTNLAVMTGDSLYYNSSGTAGTITLSSSIANYKAVEIIYAEDDYNGPWYDSIKIWNNGSSDVASGLLSACATTASSEVRFKLMCGNIRISGASLTWAYGQMCTFKPNGTFNMSELTQYATHKIYKVIGYKY